MTLPYYPAIFSRDYLKALGKFRMSNNNSSTWWEKYREAVNVTKHYRQLAALVNNRKDVAQRMISLEKKKYPGHTETWYLTRIINELQPKLPQDNCDRLIDLKS